MMYGDPYRPQLPGERRELPPEQRQLLYISMEVPQDVVEPGNEVVAEVTVTNRGTIVERVFIEVLGAPAPWSVVEPSQVELFPDGERTVQVRIRPPRYPHTPTGTVPFRVQARSTVNPTVGAFADGVLTVGSFESLDAKLVPRIARSRRKARYRLALANTGNLPISARIMAGDPEIALLFKVSAPRLEIPPGTVLTTDILVKPDRRRWVGPEAQREFEVRVEHLPAPMPGGPPPGPPETLPVTGTFVQLPYLPRWLIPAIAALGVASVSYGVYTLLKEPPPPVVTTTTIGPTAVPSPAPTQNLPGPTAEPSPLPQETPTPEESDDPEGSDDGMPSSSESGSLPTPSIKPVLPPPATMEPSSPATVAPRFYMSGMLTVQQTFLADLDEGLQTQDGADIWFEADTADERFVTPVNNTWIADIGTSDVSYQTCATATYTNQRVPVQDLPPGEAFCVRTDEGRFSAASVESGPGPSPGQLQLTFTTWPSQ
ncbi:COG1470 family protein [Flindersiella endophytica]